MKILGREKLVIQKTSPFVQHNHNHKAFASQKPDLPHRVATSGWKQRAQEGRTPISFGRLWHPGLCFKLPQFEPIWLLLHRAGS